MSVESPPETAPTDLTPQAASPALTGERKLVLAGNPNVGKSVFFNALTGLYVDVSNYPGTTIDVSKGRCEGYQVLDTPGVYGVGSFNDEERVARDIVLGADLVLNVVSACTLERDLFLTQQLLDLGKPVVVALNQMDDAARHGLSIDVSRLAELLGVPVVPCVAITGQGVTEARNTLPQARVGHATPGLEPLLTQAVGAWGGQRSDLLLAIEGDPVIRDRLGLASGGQAGNSEVADQRDAIYVLRRARVNGLVEAVVRTGDSSARPGVWLGRWLLNPWAGSAFALGILAILYWVIGDLVAQKLVGVTEGQIMQVYYEPWVRGLVSRFVGEGALHTILVGEFGVITMTVTYILGLMLPLVVAFYLFLAILEDTGYLPRLAVLVDRALASIGLNGRAVIPLILGFGCVTMATITTRLLGTQREKTIATAILGLTIPCSAQLGVILGLLAKTGSWSSWAIYGGTMFSVMVAMGTILDRLLPGQSSALLIDLPPMRLPQFRNVMRKTWSKSVGFLIEATPLFVIASLLVGIMKVTGALDWVMNALAPLVVGILHLPKAAAAAFIMGMVRRDFGAAGMTDLPMTAGQVVVGLVVITLFVPCIATVVVLYKERGWKEASSLWIGSWVLAFAIGGVLAQVIAR